MLLENPIISDFGWESSKWVNAFISCTPLERLALMRNEKLDPELMTHILDLTDTQLNIEMAERFQLAMVGLVNKRLVDDSRRRRTCDFTDGYAWYRAGKNSQAVWELAAKWPEDSGIQFLAFRSVQAEDGVKASVYSRCRADALREAILESCMPEDEETLRLGRADDDITARYIAYGRSRSMDRQEIEGALRRENDEKDKWVVDALLTNPWVGPIACEVNKQIAEEEKKVPVEPK